MTTGTGELPTPMTSSRSLLTWCSARPEQRQVARPGNGAQPARRESELLGSAAPQELTELIDDFQRNLHYNATMGKFYWGEWTNYIDPDHRTWESLTKDKVAALPIDFSRIEPGIDLIRFKIVLQYYNDIISGFSNREHLSPLIKRLETRVPDIKSLIVADNGESYDEPLIVVSLRDVNRRCARSSRCCCASTCMTRRRRRSLRTSVT